MKNTWTRLAFAIGLAIPGLCWGQMPATPIPWQAAVEATATGTTLKYPTPGLSSKPLAHHEMLWELPLVVAGRDQVGGTFCRGSMVAPGWVLTAASCVCAQGELAREQLKVEVIVERGTGTSAAKRVGVVSTVDSNKIWLFQDSEGAIPAACVASKLPTGVFPTNGKDLALIRLDMPEPLPGQQKSDPTEVEMLGTKAAPKAILEGIVDDRLKGTKTTERQVRVESVFVGARLASTPSRQEYTTAGEFVMARPALLSSSICDKPAVSVASLRAEQGAAPATYQVCADLTLGGTALNRGGTGVILADHRRPLLLGVVGIRKNEYTYTSLIGPADATDMTIAESAAKFICAMTADCPSHEAVPSNAHWFPLHRPPPDPAGNQCQTHHLATLGGVDVFLYKRDSFARPAYVFRQTNAWIDYRGAPKAYHPDDPPGALDKAINAGYKKADPSNMAWEKVLAKEFPNDRFPYQQGWPNRGYFVSMTRLVNDNEPMTSLRKYVNASRVPYIAFHEDWFAGTGIVGNDVPLEEWAHIVGSLGDIAYVAALEADPSAPGGVRYGGRSPALIADIQQRPSGGISLELGRSLKLVRAKTKGAGAAEEKSQPIDIVVMVFPGTGEEKYNGETLKDFGPTAAGKLKEVKGFPPTTCLARP